MIYIKYYYGVFTVKEKFFDGENTNTHTHILTYSLTSLGNFLYHFIAVLGYTHFHFHHFCRVKQFSLYQQLKTRFTLVELFYALHNTFMNYI